MLLWAMLGFSVSGSVFGSEVQAADPNEVETIRIEYEAPAGCPSGREFERRVFARTRSARLAAQGEAARVFQVRLRRSAGRITGTLVIRESNGSSMERTVTGEHCSELATVLALASALAIDPGAELAPDQQLEDDEHETLEPDPSSPNLAPPRSAHSQPAPDTPQPGARAADSFPEAAVRPGAPWQWQLALGPRGAWGVSPSLAPGATALLTAARGQSAWGIEVAATFGLPEQVSEARAQLRYWVLRPQWCPWLAQWSSGVTLGPCLVVEAGGVEGQGGEVANPKRQWRFWMNLELVARLRWPIAERWFGELDAGVGSPITRYHFVFTNPQTTVYDVPLVNAGLAFRLGYRF